MPTAGGKREGHSTTANMPLHIVGPEHDMLSYNLLIEVHGTSDGPYPVGVWGTLCRHVISAQAALVHWRAQQAAKVNLNHLRIRR